MTSAHGSGMVWGVFCDSFVLQSSVDLGGGNPPHTFKLNRLSFIVLWGFHHVWSIAAVLGFTFDVMHTEDVLYVLPASKFNGNGWPVWITFPIKFLLGSFVFCEPTWVSWLWPLFDIKLCSHNLVSQHVPHQYGSANASSTSLQTNKPHGENIILIQSKLIKSLTLSLFSSNL